jgi:hypothetical protein
VATDSPDQATDTHTSEGAGHAPGTFPLSPACLQDIVDEQKTHVRFLQQQLESRIKAFHDLEYQFRDKAANLERMTLSYEHLRHQLDDAEAAASVLRIEKDALAARVTRLEISLTELQAQHSRALKLFDSPVAGATKGELIAEPVGETTSK